MVGHNHSDNVVCTYEVPMIVTTNLEGGVYTDTVNRTGHHYTLETTFDAVLADYDAHRLHLIRIGSGSNRTVNGNVITIRIGESITVEPSMGYSELIWKSNDTSVMTVGTDGTITGIGAGINAVIAFNENYEEEYWTIKVLEN